MLLRGKRSVVTGATSGIGKTIASYFAKAGADVAVFGIDKAKEAEILSELEGLRVLENQKFNFNFVDVSDFESVRKGIEDIISKWGGIDIFVNNAGITKDNFLMRMEESDWDRVIAVNLKSVYNTCHALVRAMIKARSGKIINIASVIGLIGNSAQANYAASKAGVIGFSKSLAKELGSKGINVNCIAPGYIRTQMTEVLPERVKEEILSRVPLGRMGTPEDVAEVALFLASDRANYITGQTITVDGGMVMD